MSTFEYKNPCALSFQRSVCSHRATYSTIQSTKQRQALLETTAIAFSCSIQKNSERKAKKQLNFQRMLSRRPSLFLFAFYLLLNRKRLRVEREAGSEAKFFMSDLQS